MDVTEAQKAVRPLERSKAPTVYKQYAVFFKALSDETRLEILELILCGEICACEILERFEIAQPTLSYHMKILADCDLVACRKDGKRVLYTINPQWAGFLHCLQKDVLEKSTMPILMGKEYG